MIAPALSYIAVEKEDAARVAHDPGIYLLYLTPVTAVVEAIHLSKPTRDNDLALAPYLAGYGHGAAWAITTVLYLLIAILLTAIAGRIQARRAAAERVRAVKANKTTAAA